MSEHFFYVANKKHAGVYRALVLGSIVCTVLLVYLSNAYSYKDFLQEKQHVLLAYLGVPALRNHNQLGTLDAFADFFAGALFVRLRRTPA